MEKYDSKSAVKADLETFINDYACLNHLEEFWDFEELRERIYDAAWTSDCVTGNGSGSYTFSTWEAEENLCHNWSLLADALEEFGYDAKLDLEKGAEHYDVTIRCALLGRVLDELLEEAGITEDDKRFQCNRNEED